MQKHPQQKRIEGSPLSDVSPGRCFSFLPSGLFFTYYCFTDLIFVLTFLPVMRQNLLCRHDANGNWFLPALVGLIFWLVQSHFLSERSCGSGRMPLAGLNVRHLRKLTLKKWWRQFLWTDGYMIKPLILNATQPQARGQMGQRLISLLSWGLFLGLGWIVLQWLSAYSHLCLLLLLLCGSLIWAVNLTSFSRIEFILHWIQGIKNTGKLLGSDK